MKTYPVVFIPSILKYAMSLLPPAPVFNEDPPIGPGPEPEPLSLGLIAVQIFILTCTCLFLFIIGIIAAFEKSSIGFFFIVSFIIIIIGLLGGFLIKAEIVDNEEVYPKRHHKWRLEAEKYPRLQELYLQRKKEHERELEKVGSPERIAEFRVRCVQQALREIHVHSHDGINRSATRGPCEKILENHLSQYFPGEIHSCLSLEIPDYDYPYTTDCSYINNRLKLYIDIEVDEPYIHNSKEPYHFLNFWKDDNRNSFFLQNGWIVIRFAEEQVAKWPLSCCKVVATIINELTGKPIPETLASQPDLPEIKRWTEAEAQEMANKNFRKTYL
ncbi:hypothetical protein [Laspinema olomoucense]|uniref:hypothetical protein n=1 Tax=Laspinema olomoucense TaxID=3231600 RepID=UPI0021BB7416|nr:hypothetical protein [Laspinema sp. D3d]MCT7971238.1 hypothetical protein [Laspinema sp. D3d]